MDPHTLFTGTRRMFFDGRYQGFKRREINPDGRKATPSEESPFAFSEAWPISGPSFFRHVFVSLHVGGISRIPGRK